VGQAKQSLAVICAWRPKHTFQPGPGSTFKRERNAMSTTPEKTVLITGANAGLGKEIARTNLSLENEYPVAFR